MPSEFPGSPKFLKGALAAYQSQFLGPLPNVVVFQYNPDQLSRQLSHRAAPPEPGNLGAAREDVLRVQGPPIERISLSVELDATDQLAEPGSNPAVVTHGLHPALAAMELLLYPPNAQALLNRTLARAGTAQLCPADLPLVLFVWGPSRVVPVRLTSFAITEEAFDQQLNPIRARVELGMQVLSYMELRETSLGYGAYLAHQVQKEVLARLATIGSSGEIARLLPI